MKSLGGRIKGLPPGFELAHRDRRLIAQGLLCRVSLSDKEQNTLNSMSTTNDSHDSGLPVHLAGSYPSFPSAVSPNLAKLLPITAPRLLHQHSPGNRPAVPASPFRPTSTASESSTSSDDTRSLASSSMHMSPSTTVYSLRPEYDTGSRGSFDVDPPGNKYINGTDHAQPRSRSSSLRGSLRRKREVQVYAFIFTDFVLLTSPISERNLLRSPKSGESKDCWKVLDDVGLCRVVGVANHSGKLSEWRNELSEEVASDPSHSTDHDHLLAIDLLPILPEQGLDVSTTSCATPVFLSLSERMASKMALGPPQALEEARMKWLEAFQKCVQYTFRSLCFPARSPSQSFNGYSLDSHVSVASLLGSGRPLPKSVCSPGVGSQTSNGCDSGDDFDGERVEWTAKFQHVMRDMEHQSHKAVDHLLALGPSTAVQPRRQRTADVRRNSSITGPRPLLLGSQSSIVQPVEERKGLLRSFSRKSRS